MTAEICLMNRLAVVLAADSATTVTHYGSKGQEKRYFKGANKIFQLSEFHPVGVMIYGTADLLSVPWELVIKEFRRELGDKSFNDLNGYVDEFFSYINANNKLFPEVTRRKKFANNLELNIVIYAHQAEKDKTISPDDFFSKWKSERDKIDFPPNFDKATQASIIAEYKEFATQTLDNMLAGLSLTAPRDIEHLVQELIVFSIKDSLDYGGETGLVFAGFGDHSVFPSLVNIEKCGFIERALHYSREKSASIDHDVPAFVSAFAQTSMSDTFIMGFSLDVFSLFNEAIFSGLQDLINEVKGKVPGFPLGSGDCDQLVEASLKAISRSLMERANDGHAFPLKRVLSVLPVDEMADLAATLIKLESLKEKVTRPSETVGGPIDVAAITKSEGLIWINRKHFFDPELNYRYFQRRQNIYK